MATSALLPATELMVQYARYHRDRRNIATHFVGIPMIVFAIGVLLSRAQMPVGGFTATPAQLLFVLTTVWYLSRGNLALGATTALVNGLLIMAGEALAGGSTASWLAWGLGAFALAG